MKKTFPLTNPRHQPARVIERIKKDVRSYVKRERAKELPEGVDFWDFACKVGATADEAVAKHIEEVVKGIDEVAATGAEQVYIELLRKPGVRKKRD
ncbi:DUF6172 family protein [Sulfuriroseicoccus oceanibius]|uniref:Uncharacterized protein n=1 Tax=Sulfuriroseicoccus oceanibius TaxID=2707525 RepID=A0A6B3LDH1_9BACT|nr:DUF6172 family protein [Sulfuriroseicoccus oceanibius]QQL45128.1 hypothetical protein G3M56_000645 [Sulfuriroseicoccus oceanibius]